MLVSQAASSRWRKGALSHNLHPASRLKRIPSGSNISTGLCSTLSAILIGSGLRLLHVGWRRTPSARIVHSLHANVQLQLRSKNRSPHKLVDCHSKHDRRKADLHAARQCSGAAAPQFHHKKSRSWKCSTSVVATRSEWPDEDSASLVRRRRRVATNDATIITDPRHLAGPRVEIARDVG